MKEILIYRTDWKNVISAIICLAFAVSSAIAIHQGNGKATGGLVFFGLGGLFLLFLIVRSRHRPYLIITDESILVCEDYDIGNRVNWEIRFAEVESFELLPYSMLRPLKRDICVHFKTDEKQQKVYSPTLFGRISSKIFSGPAIYIHVDGISMKPQQLCDLLNKRIA